MEITKSYRKNPICNLFIKIKIIKLKLKPEKVIKFFFTIPLFNFNNCQFSDKNSRSIYNGIL